jgi:hypothetical protein
MASARIAGLRAHHGVITAKGQWPAIVTEEEHHQLTVLLTPRKVRVRAPRSYPLVGFLYCGKCGEMLRSIGGQHSRRSYSCRTGDRLTGCGGIRIKAEAIEEMVSDYVIGALTDPETRKRILAATPKSDDTGHAVLLDQLRTVDLRRTRLTDLALENALPAAEVRRKSAELDAEAAAIQQQLADRAAHTATVDLPTTIEQLTAAWKERGIDYQRLLIGLTITGITVGPGTRRDKKPDPDRLTWDLRV